MVAGKIDELISCAVDADRNLDGMVFCALKRLIFVKVDEPYLIYRPSTGSSENKMTMPCFSGSLDAALGLLEEVVPQWAYAIGNLPSPWCNIWPDADFTGDPFIEALNGIAPTKPLAVLAALAKLIYFRGDHFAH